MLVKRAFRPVGFLALLDPAHIMSGDFIRRSSYSFSSLLVAGPIVRKLTCELARLERMVLGHLLQL